MKTRIIGDIHGMVNDYKAHSIGDFDGTTIQVGDFGIGFGQSDYWHESLNDFHANGKHRFIRGNHDNPEVCKTMSGWIKDGTIENDVMFIGGAWSIDWAHRKEGIDWWREEELSSSELYQMVEIYAAIKPRIMITHDGPSKATNEMFISSGLARMSGGKHIKTRTGEALQAMFDIHQPDEWYFGHWHHTLQYKLGKTWFQCIGELDYVDVDL